MFLLLSSAVAAGGNVSKDVGTLKTKGGDMKVVAFKFEGVSGVAFILQDKIKDKKIQVMMNTKTFQAFRAGYRSALSTQLDAGQSKTIGQYDGNGDIGVAVVRRGKGPPHVLLELVGPKGKQGIFLMNPKQCGQMFELVEKAASARM